MLMTFPALLSRPAAQRDQQVGRGPRPSHRLDGLRRFRLEALSDGAAAVTFPCPLAHAPDAEVEPGGDGYPDGQQAEQHTLVLDGSRVVEARVDLDDLVEERRQEGP
jgi:hypothetical protein